MALSTDARYHHYLHPCAPFSPKQQYHHRLSHPQAVSSLAMSLPIISPLLDVKRRSYPLDNGMTIREESETNIPNILVTQPSVSQKSTSKPASFRWLKGASFRGKSKRPIQLPPTVLYPQQKQPQPQQRPLPLPPPLPSRTFSQKAEISPIRQVMNGQGPYPGNLAHRQFQQLRPSLSSIDIGNKRSSVYSQLSFDSIDSRQSLVDDSAIDEDYLSSNRLVESVTRQRPPPLPAPIALQTTSHTCPLYARYSEKAKSDTHLYFTLDETSTEEALRENDAYLKEKEGQYFFGDDDLPENGPATGDPNSRRQSSTTPPVTPMKRNSNRRTSLYAKFLSAKRQSTKAPSSQVTSSVNSVKQRFKFRSSSKVPRLAGGTASPSKQSDGSSSSNTVSPSVSPPLKPLSPAIHRTSEPFLNRPSAPVLPMRPSLTSVSSISLSGERPKNPPPLPPPIPPLRLKAPPRRRSYKSATDMSFLMRAQTDASSSFPLPPLTTNSGVLFNLVTYPLFTVLSLSLITSLSVSLCTFSSFIFFHHLFTPLWAFSKLISFPFTCRQFNVLPFGSLHSLVSQHYQGLFDFGFSFSGC